MMMIAVQKNALPVYSWCDAIEQGAMEQILHLSQHPRLKHHIAIMPDCHQGYGMPIGAVVAAHNAVIPNAVGVDIGCGMCAVKTNIREWDRSDVTACLSAIRSAIPLGFQHHKVPQHESHMPRTDIQESSMPVVSREYKNARTQVGTLGGGNHFIEYQKDTDRFLWIMIHSGSRNLGKQVADYYNRIAEDENSGRTNSIPKAWQLAWLDEDSHNGQSYIEEMQYCIDFAHTNRELMMQTILSITKDRFKNAAFDAPISIAHNYAVREKHYNLSVWIHRKGATAAAIDTVGIIPGSQGSESYIVKGKGVSESFSSCSHGAGRRLGRKEAERTLDLAHEKRILEERGIIHSIRSKKDLEEAAGAYKNIAQVMKAQNDLVDILFELSPVAVIKG
jgi:tRNA-splicing ligase RtcB (3'-phosphate/5'-hydroxy nucleic acid ligase)